MNWLLAAAIVAAFAQTGAQRPYEGPPGDHTFDAKIVPKRGRDIEIPATADGVLTQLPVRDGERLDVEALIAAIDDREAQAAVDVQMNALEAAKQRADDDIEKMYAEKSHEVAETDLRLSQEANARSASAVSAIEMLEKELVVERARLQIEKAEKDKQLALLDTKVKEAELHAAQVALERRLIKAPFEGYVQEVLVQQHEWVRAGDPILRLANFDALIARCDVKASQYSPAEVANRPVTVRIQLPRGRETTIQGRVIYVAQELSPAMGDFVVKAEIPNQSEGGFWLIQPGMKAEMTIHVNETAAANPVDSPTQQR